MSERAASRSERRFFEADTARRRLVIRAISGVFAVLGLLTTLQLLSLRAPLLTTLSNAGAGVVFALVFLFAGKQRDPSRPAATLLGCMLVQHATSAMGLSSLDEIAHTVMFTGMVPLIAGFTLRKRGTVLTALLAFATVSGVWLFELYIGQDAQLTSRALGAPLFFVIIGGVIAVLNAKAAQNAMEDSGMQAQATAHAEALARAAEERFRVVADHVSDLVSVLDADGNFIFASASYERILDFEPGQLLRRSARELLHPEDAQPTVAAFGRALQKTSAELIARLRSQDGSYRSFHLRLSGVEIDGQRHVAVTARDITVLQELTAELEAARRMDALGRLAGGIAHDFNNLLSVIGSCAEMLRLRHPQDERSARDLSVVDDAVRQAAQLTGQLLSFARRQVLPGGHAAPGSAVQRLAPLLERALGPRITLELDANSSRWMTPLADGQLEQIVMNLAVNARDAMPEGGKLRVRVQDRELPVGEVSDLAPGQYVVLEVADTGTGMTPEVCSRIFEPFYTTKGPGRGTGLGLATCFGLARQVGGTLTVESRVGEGSTFRLHIPRKVSVTVQAVELGRPRAESRGLSVLVADDEQRICELVARMLEIMGHQVVTATSGADALKHAEQRDFDLILSDVLMGGEDGLDLLEHVRRLRPEARLAVMSGFSPSPERLSALRETGIGFLAKPFSFEALRELVERNGSLPEPPDADRSYAQN